MSFYSVLRHAFENVARKPKKPVGAALAIDPNAPLQGATIGQRIMQARMRAGLNKSQFAKAVDVSHPTVYSWEADRTEIRMHNIERIAEVVGFSVEELLGRDARIVREPMVMYPALDEFIAQRKAQGRAIAPERFKELAGYRWKSGNPTVQSFAFLDAALDSTLPTEVAHAQAEATATATARALARGGRPLQKKP